LEIILKSTSADRQRLVRALEEFGREHQVPAKALQAADLALEEHLTNISHYAFDDEAVHDLVVRLSIEEDCLQVEVEDDGKPFNPLAAPPVDTSVPLDQKPIGGLGLHLIRQFMDQCHYRRQGGKNLLRMRKRLKVGSP